MLTSEDKDRFATIAWFIDLELRHNYDDDRQSILRIIKEMHNSIVDLVLLVSRIEKQLGITESVVVPGD